MKRIALVLGVMLGASAANADTVLDRYCRQAGVTKTGGATCIETARGCGRPTEYAMVADRTCLAADIVTCWGFGLRPGAKLDACVDEMQNRRGRR